MPSQTTITTGATLSLSGFLYVVIKTYQHRSRVYAFKKPGFVSLPHLSSIHPYQPNFTQPMPDDWSWPLPRPSKTQILLPPSQTSATPSPPSRKTSPTLRCSFSTSGPATS